MKHPFDGLTRAALVHRIVTLDQQGLSQRAITRTLGISRNTVKAILAAHRAQRETPHQALPRRSARAPRSTKLEPFTPRIAELLDKYPHITAQRVFEILCDEGYAGKYGIIKKHVRTVRPPPKPTPSLTAPEFGPGEMGECDWSPYAFSFTAAPPAAALRKHLVDKVVVSDVCEEIGLQPSVFYTWQKQLFENADKAFDGGRASNAREKELEAKIAALETKLARKDSVIAELSEEIVRSKKEVGEP